MVDAEETEGFECESCGTEVNEQDRYCPGCGRKLSQPESPCDKCGAGFAGGDVFCRSCGTARPDAQAHDSADSDEEWGAEFADSDDAEDDEIGESGGRPLASRGFAVRWISLLVLAIAVLTVLAVASNRGG